MTATFFMTYSIIYEDSDLLLIDKPQGLPTAPGKITGLCDLLFKECPSLKLVTGFKQGEGGLLNRLDNETGGIVLIAKNDRAFSYYAALMKENKMIKTYTAIVSGIIKKKNGTITIPIAHHYKKKNKMTTIIDKNTQYRGKPRTASTKWKLIDIVDNNSIIEAQITKGSRHQIRLHMASIGHPILGDKLYGMKKKSGYHYHFLYATGLTFTTKTGSPFSITIPPNFYESP